MLNVTDSIKGKVAPRSDGTISALCAGDGCWRHSLNLLHRPASEWRDVLDNRGWVKHGGGWHCPKCARQAVRK